MIDDEVGGGEVGLGVTVRQQPVMRPLLLLAGGNGVTERVRGRLFGGTGADQDHLVDRGFLTYLAKTVDETTLPAERVTMLVVCSTPS